MVYILMGVSGCGKSTVGKLLACKLEIPFYDADDFHSQGNIRKMKQGIPLNDRERIPWLTVLSEMISQWNSTDGAVLACSALKEKYRKILSEGGVGDVLFIHLAGNMEIISRRLEARSDHYFTSTLLESQLAILEAPAEGIKVQINASPEEICSNIIKAIRRL